MLIIRIIIFTVPLLIFPLMFNFLTQPFFKNALPKKESFFLSILIGLGLLAFMEFLLLQVFNFSPLLIIYALIAESVFLVVYYKIASLFFAKADTVLGWQPITLRYPKSMIVPCIFITVIIWHLANALLVFFHPAVWWDEIAHWVPRAKTLIESGSFKDLNNIPLPEYPRLWPIILANFMMIQEKLTHLVPLLLHFLFWIFALYTAFRLFIFRTIKDLLVFALILAGVFSLGSFNAPYTNLPLAVFYNSALILMLQIIDKKISWRNLIYVGLLLAIGVLIRSDGFELALVGIIAFCFIAFFADKILAIKSFIFLSASTLLTYLSWRIYLLYYSIPSPEVEYTKLTISQAWTDGGFVLDKALRTFQSGLMQLGNLNKPHFIIFIFMFISLYSLFKRKRSRAWSFSVLVIIGNYLLVFLELFLTSVTYPSDPGRIYWFLDGSYTRLTLHYVPFAFFASAYLLYQAET